MDRFRQGGRAINLALQGGGAHGAFTWGVLDRLLEEGSLDICAISGTSSGALNGVALASGYALGGREGARAKLAAIWKAVGQAAPPDLAGLSPFQTGMNVMEELAGASAETLAKVFSPAQLNPLNINPLREIIEANIDFALLRRSGTLKLFIAATSVSTGGARIFERHEITSDVVLASACLPTIHRAVKIEDDYYWDGGFSANPDLKSLIMGGVAGDSLLVQIEPMRVEILPKSAREIAAHMNWFAFNQPLQREIELIDELRRVKTGFLARDNARIERFRKHRFHHIDGGRHTSQLPPESKVRPDGKNLAALFDAGRHEAGRWIAAHGKKVGRRSTISLSELMPDKS